MDVNNISEIKGMSFYFSITNIAKYFKKNRRYISAILKDASFATVQPMDIYINKYPFNESFNAKHNRLEDAIVIMIKSIDVKKIDRDKIAKEFNVSKQVISHIINGRAYKNVSGTQSKYNVSDFTKLTKSIKKSKNEFLIHPLVVDNKHVDQDSSGLYLIHNKVNGKNYVGSSVNIRSRILWHTSALVNNRHYNTYLQSSINKYGIENFSFVPLANVEVAKLIQEEQKVLNDKKMNCVYNLATICTSGAIHSTITESTRLKISKANKGKKWTNEQKQRLSERKKKMFTDNEYRAKIINNLPKNVTSFNNPNTKISEKDLLEIIACINKGEILSDIAKKFPINSRSISNIKTGKTFKEYHYLINKRNEL